MVSEVTLGSLGRNFNKKTGTSVRSLGGVHEKLGLSRHSSETGDVGQKNRDVSKVIRESPRKAGSQQALSRNDAEVTLGSLGENFDKKQGRQ